MRRAPASAAVRPAFAPSTRKKENPAVLFRGSKAEGFLFLEVASSFRATPGDSEPRAPAAGAQTRAHNRAKKYN
jgi:hypothetical protein